MQHWPQFQTVKFQHGLPSAPKECIRYSKLILIFTLEKSTASLKYMYVHTLLENARKKFILGKNFISHVSTP